MLAYYVIFMYLCLVATLETLENEAIRELLAYFHYC